MPESIPNKGDQKFDDLFHGTSKQNGEVILQKGFSFPSQCVNDANRYGKGIYFWQGSPASAIYWATKKAESDPSILVTLVLQATVRIGKFLDLGTREGQKLVQKVANNLIKRNPSIKQTTEAAVLNFMAAQGWIETARIIDLGSPNRPRTPLFEGSYSVEGLRTIVCVYVLGNILETREVISKLHRTAHEP